MAIAPQHPQARLPGCGLAAYAALLLVIASAGAVGLTVSWYSLITGSEALAPTRMAYGGVVDPAVLAPMRQAGLLTSTELPDAFHAEVPNGTSACAISGGKVLRLSAEGGAQSLALDKVLSITGDATGVTVQGEPTIRCPFRPGEGGESFLRMLQAKK